MDHYTQIINARANRYAKRIDRNPRRAAALKAKRRAIDAGRRDAPPVFAGQWGPGAPSRACTPSVSGG